MTVTTLFILEVINIVIAVIFLLLFLYRLHYLRHFSQTHKYLNYYPKVRILFAILYVLLSLSLLSYNIATKQYSGDAFEYLFAGGGGQTINSLVLILLLIVLRQQLKKQRPYTPTHMVYFFYLVIISIVRFGLTLSYVTTDKQDSQIVTLILASCLMLNSCLQLGYWIAKKQSLPEFQSNNYFSFQDFRKIQSNRHDILNRDQLSSKMEHKSIEDDFPYIKPTVNVQNSKFRVILQVLASNSVLPPGLDSTDIQKMFLHPSQIQNKNITQVLKSSISLKRSLIISHGRSSRGSYHLEIISEHLYNLQQVKEMYLLCGRFPIEKQIAFGGSSLREIGIQLQTFLEQVLASKQHYQPFLLKFFLLDRQLIKIYQQKTKGFKDFLPTPQRQQMYSSPKYPHSPQIEAQFITNSQPQKHHSNLQKQKIPLPVKKYESQFDHNSIYVSVQIYKQLWIEDHYEFYMKVQVKQNGMVCYPMRRFSQFEELDYKIRAILQQNLQTKQYDMPTLPKKHLFYLDEDKINMRRMQLERYLRKLCNDYTLVEIPEVRQILLRFLNLYTKVLQLSPIYQQDFYRQVQVVKGNVSKALINNDYVTFYEFKLFRQGIQIRSITKRFNDFIVLNQQITRWMNNIKICYKTVQFPQKHLYKSETHRHEKLRAYLQSIISIKESYKIYSLNLFLNISGNHELSDDTIFSAISFIRSKRKDSSFNFNLYDNNNKNNSPKQSSHKHSNKFQMEMEKSLPDFSYSFDAKRMSALIDQLGKDDGQ